MSPDRRLARLETMNRHLSLAVAGGLAVAALTLSGCGALDRSKHDEQSYEVAGTITTLMVNGKSGRVTVRAGDGPVTVVERYEYTRDKPRTSHRTEGSTLVIEDAGCPGSRLARRCGTDFTITVPAATAVTIDTDAGDVRLQGITAALDVRLDAGSITGTDLTGPAVVHSDTGEIELRFTRPPTSVDASTDTGSTRIYLPSDGRYDVDAKVDVGDVQVNVPVERSAPNKVTVRTDVGEVLVTSA